MRTLAQFHDILVTMGSDVLFHREDANFPCICRTPEGSRDPRVHHLWQQGILYDTIENTIDGTQFTNPPVSEVAYRFYLVTPEAAIVGEAWELGIQVSPGEPQGFKLLVSDEGRTLAQGFANVQRYTDQDGKWHDLGIQDFTQPFWIDTSPLGAGAIKPDEPLPSCNEQAFVRSVTEFSVRASVQPPYNMFRRTNERANDLLGEVRKGDMFGIFPVEWNGNVLNFQNFSEAGEDFIVYDSNRYMIVAADKVPDVDGDPNHHWELGLRLIKPGRPLV